MITEKVLGAYTIVGTLSPTEQADWYRKAVEEWNINTFEVPILAGVPVVPEVVDVLTESVRFDCGNLCGTVGNSWTEEPRVRFVLIGRIVSSNCAGGYLLITAAMYGAIRGWGPCPQCLRPHRGTLRRNHPARHRIP